jgi:Transposase DDE domain group 1
MAKNAVLKRVAETGMRRARQLSRRSGKTEHIYGEVLYKAGKWPGQRRVIIKAEVVRAPDKDPRDNPRFVITNMKQSPQWIYEHVYCQRGDIENRIKLPHDLEIDRTRSCQWKVPDGECGASVFSIQWQAVRTTVRTSNLFSLS